MMEQDMSLNLEENRNKMTNETLNQISVEQRLEQLIIELFEEGATEEQVEQLLLAEQDQEDNDQMLSEASGLRLQKTYSNGSKTTKVYRDPEWEEWRVQLHVNGKHQRKADYHTNDKEDAHATAQHMIKEDLDESADLWNSERTKSEWRKLGTFDNADFEDKSKLKARVERHLKLYNQQFASKDWKHSPMIHSELKRMYQKHLKEESLDEKEPLLPTKREVSGFTKSALKHDKEKMQRDEVVEYMKSLLKRKKQVQESVDQETADKKFKKGDQVTTIYGEQARVHSVLHPMVTVIDAKGKWQDYHHTKVWLKKNK